jgi:hypothetical protein
VLVKVIQKVVGVTADGLPHDERSEEAVRHLQPRVGVVPVRALRTRRESVPEQGQVSFNPFSTDGQILST